MKLLRRFMFIESEPVEIALVQIETNHEQRAKINAAVAAAREAMGPLLLVHPNNRIERKKETA